MSNPDTKKITSREQLQTEFDTYSPSHFKINKQPGIIFDAVKENIGEFQNTEEMYSLVASGLEEDISKLDKIILRHARLYSIY